MILKTDLFRDACSIIKNAIDNKGGSLYNETLELKADGNVLCMNVTNREYFVTIKFELAESSKLNAAVNAKLFLDLVSRITSDTIDINVDGNSIKVIGNGNYKLPIIYNGDVMLELPKINIANVTNSFTINSEILQSILTFNSKELLRGVHVKQIQDYYYVDEKGCITFTSGACVNTFTTELPSQLKILLSEKVVKLFKLFKDVDAVEFSIGQDQLPDNNQIQTKVKFKTDNIELTAILPVSSLTNDVPVDAIRGMSMKEYPYSFVINTQELSDVLSRLMLFTDDKNYGKFEFTPNNITISDLDMNNIETLAPHSECTSLSNYSTILNLNNLKLILDGCADMYATICFGDNRAIVFKKQNIVDIIPELKITN